MFVSLHVLDALKIMCNLVAISIGKYRVCDSLCSQHTSEVGSLTIETQSRDHIKVYIMIKLAGTPFYIGSVTCMSVLHAICM